MKKAIDLLEGRFLVNIGRVANLTWFIFSDDESDKEGKCVIHVQSPWRIINNDNILVGTNDIYETLPGIEKDEWDIIGNNKFDIVVKEYLYDKLPLKCKTVICNKNGDLRICFYNYKLEVFVDSCSVIEHWRLIDYVDNEHYVVFEQE